MWSGTVGLVNGTYKYLTAETFGNKINANGAALKKKQLWTIEPYPLTASTTSTTGSTNGSANGRSRDLAAEELDDLEHVAIRSHLGTYLAADSFGNVTCESSELWEGARFTITICSMSLPGSNDGEQIYWAFRNVSRGYYLGAGADGMINCAAKVPQTRAELWHVHLIPTRGATMFALKSIGRRRYARAVYSSAPAAISQNGDSGNRNGNGNGNVVSNGQQQEDDQIQVDATHPWGPEMLFQFKYLGEGKYALCTSDGLFLTREGYCVHWSPTNGGATNGGVRSLASRFGNGNALQNGGALDQPPEECLFTVEYHGGFIAFRDSIGRYLAATGRGAVLKTRSPNVSRDELFSFEVAPIQVALRAAFNHKWVSVKQGMDLAANQNEISPEYETFNFVPLESNNKNSAVQLWNIRTREGNWWAPGQAATVSTSCRDAPAAGKFALEWNRDDGTCSIKVMESPDDPSGKYVCARKSGQLFTSAAGSGQEPSRFYLHFTNRNTFNLRAVTSSGFIGLKMGGKLDAAKITPDSICVEYGAGPEQGPDSDSELDPIGYNCAYFRMGATGKYWSAGEGGLLAADAATPSCAQSFQLELRSGVAIAIRAYDSSSFLNVSQTGVLSLQMTQDFGNVTLWEF